MYFYDELVKEKFLNTFMTTIMTIYIINYIFLKKSINIKFYSVSPRFRVDATRLSGKG